MTNTTDYSLADQTGADFRGELNQILSDIQSTNSGDADPLTTVAYKLFVNTQTNKLKIRNGSNNDWIDLGSISAEMGHATVASPTFTGLVTAPEVSISGTSRLKLPVGTTVQRPNPAATGDSRYNSTIGQQEIYDGARWVSVFVPVGTVSYYAGSTPPKGYLKCNGATIANGNTAITGNDSDGEAIGTVNTSKLYAIVGATLPDLRGEFIRGWDDGKGTDNGRTIKSTQTDQNKAHGHNGATAAVTNFTGTIKGISESFAASGTASGAFSKGGSFDCSSTPAGSSDTGDCSQVSFDGNHSHTIADDGGTESRPRNVALLAIIKY